MLFEHLTDNDKDIIRYWIKNYAPGNEGKPAHHEFACEMAPLNRILSNWEWAKRDLFHMFGDQLILSRSYEYELPVGQIANDIATRIYKNDEYGTLERRYKYICYHESRMNDARYAFDNVWDSNNFARNNIVNGYVSDWVNYITFEDGKQLRLSPEMRPLKIIQRIFEEYGDKYYKDYDWRFALENLRIMISQARNKQKLKGQLCLSIHPMDFMTMSDNDNNWSSCMRWRRNGEYSQGTIEMMNSGIVVVAYLHNPDNMMNIDGVNKWNNKKWRELFIVDGTGIISEIKAYPYEDSILSKTCIDWLKELSENYHHRNYTYCEFGDSCNDLYITKDNTILAYDTDHNDDDVDWKFNVEFTTGYMYNDFGAMCRCHYGYIDIAAMDEYTNHGLSWYYVEYSGYSQCMWCGGEIVSSYNDAEDESTAELRVCGDCIRLYECDECGCRSSDSDRMIYVERYDTWLCTSCYERYVTLDPITDEEVYFRDTVNLRLLAGYDKQGAEVFVSPDDVRVDPDSFEGSLWSEYFTCPPHEMADGWWSRKYYMELGDCTERGLRLFGFENAEQAKTAIDAKLNYVNDLIERTLRAEKEKEKSYIKIPDWDFNKVFTINNNTPVNWENIITATPTCFSSDNNGTITIQLGNPIAESTVTQN